MERRGRILASVCAFLALLGDHRASAVLNNGFETDNVYVCRDGAQSGELRVFSELSGAFVTDLAIAGSNWESLTFTGTGTSDARLFVARTSGTDIRIEELNSVGTQLASVMVSSLASVGTSLTFGNIRYSPFYPDSLFVSARSNASGQSRGMIWELNLAMNTLKNTYTGPTMPTPGAGDASERQTNIAIGTNGTIYMIGRHLNSASDNGEGDLVKMTGLNTFQVLVDGTTKKASDARWNGPHTVLFRKGDPSRGDGTDTLLVAFKYNTVSATEPTLELYLDTVAHPVDGNGNLAVRSSPVSVFLGWNGHQDTVTGGLWIAALRGGFHQIRVNDSVLPLETGANWADVDSPPYYGPVPPRAEAVTATAILAGTTYSQQLLLTQGAPVTWSKIAGPASATVNVSGLVSGWTPSLAEAGTVVTFTIRASNAQGNYDVTWQVTVIGFIPDFLFATHDPNTPAAPRGRIGVYRKTDLAQLLDLTPISYLDAWNSLTFSGTGHDAVRLFVMRPEIPPIPTDPSTDIRIAELNAQGQTVKSVLLGTLLGSSPGSHCTTGSLRFSPYHNHLFVSFDPDWSLPTNLSVAYEIDLELTAVLNTYHGDITNEDEVNCEINPTNGTLYMVSRSMGRNPDNSKGNVIAINTSGGSTNTFTTLINGTTNTDPNWRSPRSLIYRDTRNPSGHPTLVILTEEGVVQPILEYILDQVDGNGNLVKRGEPLSTNRGWLGRQDRGTGVVNLAAARGNLFQYYTNDTNAPFGAASGASPSTRWYDIDTPYIDPCHDPFADADGDTDVDLNDFAIFQLCFTGSAGGPVPSSPAYCGCMDRVAPTGVDALDFLSFTACQSREDVPANPCCDGGPSCP